jgi:hypothetical protein
METLRRLIPLAGLVFAASVFFAYGVVSGDSPDIDASPREVASFYSDNSGSEQATALLLAFGAPFLAIFAVALHRALSPPGGRSAAATLALLGGGVAVAGFLAQAGVHLALAEGADEGVEPVALQALSTLNEDIFLGSAGAILGTAELPRWLGWVGLALGALTFTFAAFQAFAAAHLWIVIMSVLLYRRQGPREPSPSRAA